MNLEEFQEKYKDFTQKQQITICCDICGKENKINREKAELNIKTHGQYIDRSCSMKNSHRENPRGEETREKQSLAHRGKKLSSKTKTKMSESAKEKWKTDWGKKQRKILAKKAAKQHASTNMDKSKRKILYISAKNNGGIRTCNSSAEYVFCEDFLEKDPDVIAYETQVYYEIEGRCRSLDFLIHYADRKKAVEIKPLKRLGEEANILQMSDSEAYARQMGWEFEVWTEEELGISNWKEATCRADEYRKQHYKIDYSAYRQEMNRKRARKHYQEKITEDKVVVFCEFCKEYHVRLKKTYNENVAKNGRFICIKENGHLIGKKPRKKKESPYGPNMKKCNGPCDRVLPLENFSKGKAVCKECRSDHYRRKYQERG